jgi:ATP-dependent protease ClpP protease subunit
MHESDARTSYKREFACIDYVHDYGIDPEKREIYLFGRDEFVTGQGTEGYNEEPGVEYSMANQFIKNIRVLQGLGDKPILIHMKTCGGDWMEGMGIYQSILACPNHVTILNYTHARSMSSIVLQAADHRVMMPYSEFMMHKGTQTISGTITQVETEYAQLQSDNDTMMEIYADKLMSSEHFKKKSFKQCAAWIDAKMKQKEEVYFTAQETVNLNFADTIFDYDWKKLKK